MLLERRNCSLLALADEPDEFWQADRLAERVVAKSVDGAFAECVMRSGDRREGLRRVWASQIGLARRFAILAAVVADESLGRGQPCVPGAR